MQGALRAQQCCNSVVKQQLDPSLQCTCGIAYMHLFLQHNLGSTLQKIQKISTKFAFAFHNIMNLHFMLQFPLPVDLGLQLEKGNNLTFNAL